MTSFAVSSARPVPFHASTCFRIGSKFRCMPSTPTERMSTRLRCLVCLARTGVKSPLNAIFERPALLQQPLFANAAARSSPTELRELRGADHDSLSRDCSDFVLLAKGTPLKLLLSPSGASQNFYPIHSKTD